MHIHCTDNFVIIDRAASVQENSNQTGYCFGKSVLYV